MGRDHESRAAASRPANPQGAGEESEGEFCRAAGELVGASSLAWVSLPGDGDVVLEGERILSPWDFQQIVDHMADKNSGDPSEYVLVNETRQTGWGARYPQIENLLAIPVTEKSFAGWVAGGQQTARRRTENRRATRAATLMSRIKASQGRGGFCLSAGRTPRCSCHSPPCFVCTPALMRDISTSRTSWWG